LLFAALKKVKNSKSTFDQWFCRILHSIKTVFGIQVTEGAWLIGGATNRVCICNGSRLPQLEAKQVSAPASIALTKAV